MILPAASIVDDLSAGFAAVAAVGAVIALRFARQTVLESDAARKEVATQHHEQMDGMTALSGAMRTAAAAAARQEQAEAENRQADQIQRIAELLVQTVDAADAEAAGHGPRRTPSRLPLMLQTIETAKNAWQATGDLDQNRNPAAADLLALRPDLMDADKPLDVSRKCSSALMAINARWTMAMIMGAGRQMEQPVAVMTFAKEVREAGELPNYLLKLIATEGPKTEADLCAAVHLVPQLERLVPSWVAYADATAPGKTTTAISKRL